MLMPIQKETTEYFAGIIFANASALNSNLILLNSVSKDFPVGWETTMVCWEKYVAFHDITALMLVQK